MSCHWLASQVGFNIKWQYFLKPIQVVPKINKNNATKLISKLNMEENNELNKLIF